MNTSTLEGFRHMIPMPLRWGDMDALGHVNNANYLTYLEHARINYVRTLDLWTGEGNVLGMIVAKVVIDYRLPLVAEDEVSVHTRVARLGTKSFDTEQVIARRVDGELQRAAESTITIVVFDYSTGSSAPIPDEWRARVIDYEPALSG
ncbi:MAG: acyl-CoA thioesterase [Chloroflexi bacterium]|nr:acyl-CoA thioesterase [Chloroflexota bacterium]